MFVHLMLTVVLVLAHASGDAIAGIRSSVETYASGGETVRVELFVPTARGKHPAVLMLYGSGGLEFATGDCFRNVARRLAGQGYVTLIPHFFDSTGHVVGQPIEQGDYQTWRGAVKDAVEFAVARNDVDPDRLGLLGYSLGSGLAYSHASTDERVKAVASLSGVGFVRAGTKPPATLLLYGSKDKSVSSDAAKRFEDALAAEHVAFSSHVYRGMGHNFDVSRFADAGRRAAAFFDNHVKRAKARE